MRTVGLITLLAITFSTLAYAQDIREERVKFKAGQSAAKIDGRIKGYETIDYLLEARAGQRISIKFKTSNPSSYFNLLPANSQSAIHIGSTEGNSYQGTLPDDGDYRIRVYLMRNAARRDEVAKYSLNVEISGSQANLGRVSDFADGLSGGPDYWEVAKVPANDTLNVHSGPSTGNDVIGELANGDTARNLGCRMVGKSKWCKIEAGFDQKFIGWVNGHYLIEAENPPRTGNVKSGSMDLRGIGAFNGAGPTTGRIFTRNGRSYAVMINAKRWASISST